MSCKKVVTPGIFSQKSQFPSLFKPRFCLRVAIFCFNFNCMKVNLLKVSVIFWAVLLLAGGVAHFVNPEFYYPMIPDAFPKDLSNYGAGVLEVLLGIGILLPATRKLSTMGILLLMIAFLPLHIRDLFLDEPIVGSQVAAIVRLAIQFLLIAWLWWMWRKHSK